MKSILLTKARIIDPSQGWDAVGSVLVVDGRITWLGRGSVPMLLADCKVLELPGMIVCPGFIDLHCHLREPGYEARETIATGTRAASRGGFTTVCCMPNTRPPIDSPTVTTYIRKKADAEGVVRVLPVGCVTRGRLGKELVDMKALAQAGVVAFSDDGDPVRDEDIMRGALLNSKRLGFPVIDHCEDPIGGPPEGEMKIVARDLRLAEETGGWLHIAHVSTARAVELIADAKKRGIRVTAEATPHHLTLTEKVIEQAGAMAKVNPPLRTEKDRLALVNGLKEGTIDVVATDHAPHIDADKHTVFAAAASGISGFETSLGSLMGLVTDSHLTISELVHRLTASPARILSDRCGQAGTLAIGAPADITVFDPDQEWVVYPETFASKGKNTPLAGVTLRGRVMVTIVGGRVIYQDLKLKETDTVISDGRAESNDRE